MPDPTGIRCAPGPGPRPVRLFCANRRPERCARSPEISPGSRAAGSVAVRDTRMHRESIDPRYVISDLYFQVDREHRVAWDEIQIIAWDKLRLFSAKHTK